MAVTIPALKDEHQEILNKSKGNDWSVPEYKIKHFIAGAHIHPFHQLRQLLMELNSRQENLEKFEYDIRKLELEIELEKEYKERTEFNAQKKLHDLEIEHLEYQVKILDQKFRSSKQDRDKILKLIDDFNNSEHGKLQSGERYIDILDDPEKTEQLEKDYWEYRLAKQASLDMIAYGRVGVGNMEAIMQLPADSQNKALAMAYEILLTNENRMNLITDKVQERLQNGQTVSDITKLSNMYKDDFMKQLEKGIENVPLIQKR